MNPIYQQTKAVIEELCEKANLKAGSIVVVGCSTSEVLGSRIGTNSNPDTNSTKIKVRKNLRLLRIQIRQNRIHRRCTRKNPRKRVQILLQRRIHYV